jgi:hypothetical protein
MKKANLYFFIVIVFLHGFSFPSADPFEMTLSDVNFIKKDFDKAFSFVNLKCVFYNDEKHIASVYLLNPFYSSKINVQLKNMLEYVKHALALNNSIRGKIITVEYIMNKKNRTYNKKLRNSKYVTQIEIYFQELNKYDLNNLKNNLSLIEESRIEIRGNMVKFKSNNIFFSKNWSVILSYPDFFNNNWNWKKIGGLGLIFAGIATLLYFNKNNTSLPTMNIYSLWKSLTQSPSLSQE